MQRTWPKRKLLLPIISLILLTFLIAMALSLPPAFPTLQRQALGTDRLLLDRHGQMLHHLRTDFQKRRWIWQPLKTFPAPLLQTLVQVEDQRFFSHFGIDLRALARASWALIKGQRIQGASTISMQVADLIQPAVLEGRARIQKGSIWRKLPQMVAALALETRWTKEEILEAYVNLIHLRGEIQGVSALALAAFQKDPGALDLAESYLLAMMISTPNASATTLAQRACPHWQRAVSADCSPLQQTAERLRETKPTLTANHGVAPHLAQVVTQLHPEESVIATTIDLALQKTVLEILTRNLERLKEKNVHDTAAIVIDNTTGEVLAYVGALPQSKSPHVNGVQAQRQAGSALKPFYYGKGIDMKRLTAASILLDEPTAISWGEEVYRPTNYDKFFYGPISVREALASSLNVPAVKTVASIGLHQTYRLLQELHLSHLKAPDFYGVSMALGAVEVRLDELSNAYRMLANGGEWHPLTYSPANPKKIGPPAQRIFAPETAFILTSILADPNARSIGFGWDSPLETPFFTAVKTGTSKDYRDNWCIGFSGKYTVGVWAGNFDASAMREVSGVTGAGSSWFEIMNYLHRQEKSALPTIPAGIVKKQIRHAWQSREKEEYFLAGTEPTQSLVELAPGKRAEFVFPAESSVLVADPHLDPKNVALFIRFKGEVPSGTHLFWGKRDLGVAQSPWKITELPIGKQELSLRSPAGEILARVRFEIRGTKTQ
jgi:penicillin-binding protein 1C